MPEELKNNWCIRRRIESWRCYLYHTRNASTDRLHTLRRLASHCWKGIRLKPAIKKGAICKMHGAPIINACLIWRLSKKFSPIYGSFKRKLYISWQWKAAFTLCIKREQPSKFLECSWNLDIWYFARVKDKFNIIETGKSISFI